jgi:hypothetical protein
MGTPSQKSHRELSRRRRFKETNATGETSGGGAKWFVLLLIVIGIACLLIGCLRHGFDLKNVAAALSSLTLGIGFIAIGLLELEWLERIIGFADGIYSGLMQWFWTTWWYGSLSENELVGRRGATVLWMMIGVPVFVLGCLIGLRVIAW